jgi:hypothetical protein
MAKIDSQIDDSSPRSWTSLLNSCTKLVSSAANAIEMEAAVEATRNELAESDRGKEQSTNRRAGQRTTTTHNTGSSIWQRPVGRAHSHTTRSNPATPPPKPSTRRRSSATAPTQSSTSKSMTRATGPRLTTQSKTRHSPKDPKNVVSERPRTVTRKMSNQSTAVIGKKLEDGTKPKAGSRVDPSSAL